MTGIELFDASVDYPIYSASARSLKTAIAQKVGGAIRADDTSRVVVRALDRVNLSLRSGDRLALFGSNGSGKSTLLKVLAGILEPSSGRAQITGHVSALLDLQMGMDPEATGYENILMRSIFLGASFEEARSRIPEIEAFSELGEYLRFPIRTYSSGMIVRLAFAISTVISPEILAMDEQVGAADAAFSLKAQARINELIGQAHILVFATHNIEAAKKTCNRAVVLKHGRIDFDGAVDAAELAYKEARSEAEALSGPLALAEPASSADQPPLKNTEPGASSGPPLSGPRLARAARSTRG
jgi:ABC-type polysaccharide/polyol phosphate transport system ATPase subunit